MLAQTLAHQPIRLLRIKHALFVKANDLGGIHKIPAERGRHNQAVEILAARACIIPFCAGGKIAVDLVKLRGNVIRKPKLLNDLRIARADRLERHVDILACRSQIIAMIEQVGDLIVLLKALARRRRHHIPAFFVGTQDLDHLFKLGGVR